VAGGCGCSNDGVVAGAGGSAAMLGNELGATALGDAERDAAAMTDPDGEGNGVRTPTSRVESASEISR
jgi:hypothetical protein